MTMDRKTFIAKSATLLAGGAVFASSVYSRSRSAELNTTHGNVGSQARTVLAVQEGPDKVFLFSGADSSRRKVIDMGEKPHEIELESPSWI